MKGFKTVINILYTNDLVRCTFIEKYKVQRTKNEFNLTIRF